MTIDPETTDQAPVQELPPGYLEGATSLAGTEPVGAPRVPEDGRELSAQEAALADATPEEVASVIRQLSAYPAPLREEVRADIMERAAERGTIDERAALQLIILQVADVLAQQTKLLAALNQYGTMMQYVVDFVAGINAAREAMNGADLPGPMRALLGNLFG